MQIIPLSAFSTHLPEVLDWSFGWGLQIPILGRKAIAFWDGTIQKIIGDFQEALHSNFCSIFARFRDIATFVLQHATFPHPT